MEMVTGGLIAVYLAIQPYTGWPAPAQMDLLVGDRSSLGHCLISRVA
jgi:hypothetical protein